MKFRLEPIEVSLINNSEFRPGMNAFLDIFQLACVLDWAEDNCKNLPSPPHGRFELFTVAFAFLNPPQRQIPDNGSGGTVAGRRGGDAESYFKYACDSDIYNSERWESRGAKRLAADFGFILKVRERNTDYECIFRNVICAAMSGRGSGGRDRKNEYQRVCFAEMICAAMSGRGSGGRDRKNEYQRVCFAEICGIFENILVLLRFRLWRSCLFSNKVTFGVIAF
ncbi:hypothetical protein QE152_g19090 [Popillia japonica]|uniref:Uncharacterized protein n=1 Tax=Popillia japonica TaxID=7064 RepID=A0AAW1L2Z8_POPJA